MLLRGRLGRAAGGISALVPIFAGRAAEEIILGSVSAGTGGSDSSDLTCAKVLPMQLQS